MANLLLIEPDRVLAETFQQALETAGHQVTVCAGAQTAVLMADEIKPELVIIEIQLVEHSGIEFLYEFRSYQDWQNIPIIIHSQVPPSEFGDNWQLLRHQLGVSLYLYKPQTSLEQLITAIEEQLTTIKA